MQRKPQYPCPGCGAFARVFKAGQSTCAYCGTTLTPLPFQHPAGIFPQATPLRIGRTATIGGKKYVAVGRLLFEEFDDGEYSRWEEWVLIAQEGEILYLEYDEGNWTLSEPLGSEPTELPSRTERGVATIKGVEGEIPWEVHPGETVDYAEYGNGQYSSEATADGVEWYRGRRAPAAEVYHWFGLREVAAAEERRDVVLKDRAGVGCLSVLLSIVALVLVFTAGKAPGVLKGSQSVMASQIPEEGLALGPFRLDSAERVHRLTIASELSSTSMAVQAVLEDAEGATLDMSGELWDESGYDDGYWHEWVTETSQDFRVARSGNYYIRLFADPEAAAANAPVRYEVRSHVISTTPLAWFGGIGIAFGIVLMVAGSPPARATIVQAMSDND